MKCESTTACTSSTLPLRFPIILWGWKFFERMPVSLSCLNCSLQLFQSFKSHFKQWPILRLGLRRWWRPLVTAKEETPTPSRQPGTVDDHVYLGFGVSYTGDSLSTYDFTGSKEAHPPSFRLASLSGIRHTGSVQSRKYFPLRRRNDAVHYDWWKNCYR